MFYKIILRNQRKNIIQFADVTVELKEITFSHFRPKSLVIILINCYYLLIITSPKANCKEAKKKKKKIL